MQESFDFMAADPAFIRRALSRVFEPLGEFERRQPVWKMIRSLIGSQTYDEVAEAALEALMLRWPHPRHLAGARESDVLSVIREVTHAQDKARNLIAALQWIGREQSDFRLDFLALLPVRDALSWLERFPGVGPKVAAATLNASTLRMLVFIVDSHVHRILLRFGLIGSRASAEAARDQVTAAAGMLRPDDLLELFAQLKRLGQLICRPFLARCDLCPLVERCQKKVHLGVPLERRKAA